MPGRSLGEALLGLALAPLLASPIAAADGGSSDAGTGSRAAPPWPCCRPVATFLRLQLDLVVSQRRLLLTVPLWYLGPLGVGVVLFFAGASPSPWLSGAYVAIVAVFFHRLYRLNRAAVASELEPRERELRLWIELVDQEPRQDVER